jgi:IclR family acetate operon transcriptional repressor
MRSLPQYRPLMGQALEHAQDEPPVDAVEHRSPSSGVNATLRILDLLAARGPLSLADLTRDLRLPKSTTHRICGVLVDRAWAIRDADGRYGLGIRALRLGSYSTELPIVTAFRSVAAAYLDDLDETIALAVVDGVESLYIALEDTSQPVRYVTHIGSKSPAFASASGRVVLADQSPEAIAALFSGRPLITPTGRRLGGVSELQAILQDVRRNALAENWDETARGLYAASVPIGNGAGVTIAALTTLVPLSRVTPERRERIVASLKEQGRRLSELVEWLPAYSARTSSVP